jgi:hypothetical protein
VYRRNVFSHLKVTWGTYPNNLGHTDDPGCFRCLDEAQLPMPSCFSASGTASLRNIPF